MLFGIEKLGAQEGSPDVIVVGAGAVGLSMAVKLARSGKRVMLLEAGPEGLEATSQNLFHQPASKGSKTHEGLHLGRFRMFGGTTNFWGGAVVPFDSSIFEDRPWVGASTAWPISRATIDPYYVEAFNHLGMAKVIGNDAEILARLGQKRPDLGSDLSYFFVRFVPQPNLAVHFGDFIRTDHNLRCCVNASVVGLEVRDGSITGVKVAGPNGESHTVSARNVVLANGTIEITRLLMMPLADGRPAPWSKNSWLGRGFIDHLHVVAGRIAILNSKLFSDAFDNIMLGGIKYQPKVMLTSFAQRRDELLDICAQMVFNATAQQHIDNAKIFLRSFFRGNMDRDFSSYPKKIMSLFRFGLPMAWRYLRSNRIYNGGGSEIDLWISCEQIMKPESRIELTQRIDAAGLPIADLHWDIDGRELETMATFSERLAQGLAAAGLASFTLDPKLAARDPGFMDKVGDAYHHMGMCRMATDGDEGVVDTDLRVFGTSNLYVAGAAVYPSTGFPNPTLTAIALGLRLADHLIGTDE